MTTESLYYLCNICNSEEEIICSCVDFVNHSIIYEECSICSNYCIRNCSILFCNHVICNLCTNNIFAMQLFKKATTIPHKIAISYRNIVMFNNDFMFFYKKILFNLNYTKYNYLSLKKQIPFILYIVMTQDIIYYNNQINELNNEKKKIRR